MRCYILDGDHQLVPATLWEYAMWSQLPDARRVDRTQISEEIDVSTVFLGYDHRFGDGPPIVFETMIFGGPHDSHQERCSTWEEAIAMHERVVAIARGVEVL